MAYVQRTDVEIKGNDAKGYKDKEGNPSPHPWRACLSYYEITGYRDDGSPIEKRRQRNKKLRAKTYKGAKAEADKWLGDLKEDQAARLDRQRKIEAERRAREAKANIPSVCEVIRAWTDALYADGGEDATIERSTYTDYRKCLARIKRTLPDRPVDELTADDVRDWDKKASTMWAPTTFKKTRVVLSAGLQYAVDNHLIDESPVPMRKRKKRERIAAKNATDTRKYNYLDKHARTVLLDELDELDRKEENAPDHKADTRPVTIAARLALYCGLREAECCGLRSVTSTLIPASSMWNMPWVWGLVARI